MLNPHQHNKLKLQILFFFFSCSLYFNIFFQQPSRFIVKNFCGVCMVLSTRTYAEKCSNLYLMPPSVIQIINQNSRAFTSSSKGKKCVAQSEQSISL